DIELSHRLFGLRHQRLDLVLVRQVAGQHVDALLQIAGEFVERLTARAGDRNACALLVQRARNRPTDAAGCPGYQRGLPGQVEHCHSSRYWICQPRPPLNAATSSGVPIADPVAPGAIRFSNPVSTLPAPTS